jgi:hypothetical protein
MLVHRNVDLIGDMPVDEGVGEGRAARSASVKAGEVCHIGSSATRYSSTPASVAIRRC